MTQAYLRKKDARTALIAGINLRRLAVKLVREREGRGRVGQSQ